jgi:Tfp pilus assembly protein FimT
MTMHGATASSTRPRSRGAFTAVELVVVIGIMLLLMGMAAPAVVKSIRRGAVNSAANDVQQCWRQARMLALTHTMPRSSGGQPAKHYGLALVQRTGERPFAAVIFDNQDEGGIAAAPTASILRRDPTGSATDDQANPPVAKYLFNRSVRLAVAKSPGAAATVGDEVLVVYSQYGSGLPIAPADVAAGRGSTASAVGLGLAGNPAFNLPASPLCAQLQLQTVDFDTAPVKRGYAVATALYPVGVLAAQEL